MRLADRSLDQLTGTIRCTCGRTHALATSVAAVVQDAPSALAQALERERAGGELLLLCDRNTYQVLGERAQKELAGIGKVALCLLRGDDLHADEEALGSALMACSEDTARVIAVGAGTINDIARFVASRLRRPYDVIGTAPSMDGYVSSVSPLLRRGFKITFEAIAPSHALIDSRASREAPLAMIAAGLGDVMGKYTALADWGMARDVYGEYHCEQTALLMQRAVDTCAACAGDLAARDPHAVDLLGEGLLLSGMAMQLVGNSRPASGAEHHLSHFWEMRQLQRSEKPTLHGDKVGYAALLMLDYYRLFFARQRPMGDIDTDAWVRGMRGAYGSIAQEVIDAAVPDGAPRDAIVQRALAHWQGLKAAADAMTPLRGRIAAMLRDSGGPTTARELGLSREDVRDALLYAKEIRPRPTIMRLGFAWGIHKELCDQIMEDIVYAE